MWGNLTDEQSVNGQIMLQLTDLPVYLEVLGKVTTVNMTLHPEHPHAQFSAPM